MFALIYRGYFSGKIEVFQSLLYVSAYRKKSLTDFIVLGYLFICLAFIIVLS